ncbi:hypothetical protein BABINDRAFT_8391 [Babjeviella inositovora NRRL Y-12698]|uniref:Uncharacterized protein n=1 Tax=Babjeviella inositovora NRRL Y-12698 TaxID=984486 RepID=A0A1E3QP81_9ASCO|nr:uncharacterized protein BABINDRAFT_8391 [Babjeviella inositovora NRRL Y-12698]ODQ79460.1 hypothetical protein BABINDRAFT_8391 [Babjeviella inositovora NRRL Y-12698]
MSKLHEKLQLEAGDVRYLQMQFHKNASDKLNLHLPSSSNTPNSKKSALYSTSDDPLKLRISAMIHDFIDDAFELAKEGMIIDGHEPSSRSPLLKYVEQQLRTPTRVEPYDFAMNEELRRLYQSVEEETLQLTKMRSEIPQRTVREYESIIGKIDAEVNDFIKALEEQTSAELEVIAKNADLDTPELEGVTEDYEECILELSRLAKGVSMQQSNLQKIDDICDFLLQNYLVGDGLE